MNENNVFINVNGDNYRELVQQYGIRGYPTVLIGTVSEINGEYQLNIEQQLLGYQNPIRFLDALMSK